ncbi:MAG: ATP-binding protein [Magnetococcus sp. YQC-5]
MSAIEPTRKRLKILGFDDTYLDLIEDFRAPITYGKIDPELAMIPNKIKNLLYEGEIVEKGMEFVFKRGTEEYPMAQTAEGFKKIGIISRLILNRSITKGSILLVDEPEANLHPKAIIAMADILFDLSQAGVQVYAATHSYFFLKRIEQLARMNDKYVCLADLRRSPDGVKATFHDLRHEIPDNPILAQSAYLLNEDIRLDWGQ